MVNTIDQDLVSIVIRTCGKPTVLYNALQSVRSQIYPHIETIIVEDGLNISEGFIKENFSDLPYKYISTGKRLGRTKAGNIGLNMASGRYVNFLDEDDKLLKNHITVLMQAMKETGCKAVYSVAEEQQIVIKSMEPYDFSVKRRLVRYRYPFNRLLLCYMNVFPIQSVMFDRQLYEKYGGFDENLDKLEDWDLWLRYALKEPFHFVDKVTSVYYTPYKDKRKACREASLKNAEQMVNEKHAAYLCDMNAMQVKEEMDYILNVFNKKSSIYYLKKIQNYLLYRDR